MPAERPTDERLLLFGAAAASSRLVRVWRATSRSLGYSWAWNANRAGRSHIARSRLQIVTVWRTDQSTCNRPVGALVNNGAVQGSRGAYCPRQFGERSFWQ
jgi:hypothetical protein